MYIYNIKRSTCKIMYYKTVQPLKYCKLHIADFNLIFV